MAQQLQWFDRSQPQTLQNAVVLAYVQTAFTLFFTLGGKGIWLLIAIGPAIALAVGAFGIANSKKWGYWLAAVSSVAIFGLYIRDLLLGAGFGIILNLLFSGVMVALLLHPLSRSYQKIWFR